MLFKTANDFNINLQASWLIGDKEIDILAGLNGSINKNILVRSGHPLDANNSQANFILNSIYECQTVIKTNFKLIKDISYKAVHACKNGNKILLAGNGGSAGELF